MRTIKFRGQRLDNGEWVYGDLLQWKSHGLCAITPQQGNEWESPSDFEVKPETVGQFIGIDTKGKEVYDGDYMRYKRRNGQWCKCTVVYENAGFTFENKTEQATYHAAIFMNKGKIYAEKIGNKFDSKPLTVNKFRHNEDF